MTNQTIPPAALCADCGEELSGDEVRRHTGCCDHRGQIDGMLGFGGDPAREDPSAGICADCGAEVHIENDGDRYVWVLS